MEEPETEQKADDDEANSAFHDRIRKGRMTTTMKKAMAFILAVLLSVIPVPGPAEIPAIETTVARITEYGHVKLDITETDFTGAGFSPGDAHRLHP